MSREKTKPRKISRVFKAVAVIFAAVLTVAAGIAGGAVGLSYGVIAKDLDEQVRRVAELEANPSAPVNEADFADFDLSAQNPKINRIRVLNTHNSYRKRLTQYIDFFAGNFLPKSVYEELVYEHGALTDQLNSGIRSFELDLHSKNGKFSVYHISKIDCGSFAPDFGLALKELKIWSDNNPGHVPVTILLEYKNDPAFLDLFADKPDSAMLSRLNDAVATAMGEEKLVTPADVIGGYADMQSAIAAENWPTLNDAKGKFVFLLHYGDGVTDKYIGLDKSLKSLALFPTVYADSASDKRIDEYREYASYILCNTPDADGINALVSAGYIVRTRADADMRKPEAQRTAALSSLAQIITTDYEKGRALPAGDYYLDLGNGKTVSLLTF
ncbi:MAG: phosphatidylinositol-specific phospholipase C1-like protein [Clostridiales bacterium]|jgi:hypothetical protein|nr:phosphatidylinositol-specific phospholipase C1-like protein [Clostridiales bacterium]